MTDTTQNPTPEAVYLQLASSLDANTSALTAYNKVLSQSSQRPKSFPMVRSAYVDTAGNAVITFGNVPAGRQWSLRSYAIGGVTWATATTGSAVLFVDSMDHSGSDFAVPTAMVVNYPGSMPASVASRF